jgi:hypothetical protein
MRFGLKRHQPCLGAGGGVGAGESVGLPLEPSKPGRRSLSIGRLDARAADQVGAERSVLGLLSGLDSGTEVGAGRLAVLQVPGKLASKAGGLSSNGAELLAQGWSRRTLEQGRHGIEVPHHRAEERLRADLRFQPF